MLVGRKPSQLRDEEDAVGRQQKKVGEEETIQAQGGDGSPGGARVKINQTIQSLSGQ